MKAHLLYRDRDFNWKWALRAAAAREGARTGRRHHGRDFDPNAGLPWNAEPLRQDLELNTLLSTMAREDDCIFEVARRAIVTATQNDIETIRYRQNVLRDCLNHPQVVREIYALAVEPMGKKREQYLHAFKTRHPDSILRWSIETLEALLGAAARLRAIADSQAGAFVSEGWSQLFATMRAELSDAYLVRAKRHLAQLRFRNGVLLSAELGKSNKGTGYRLHLPPGREGTWLGRRAKASLPWLFAPQPPAYSFTLHPRDENGFRALAELQDRGIAIAANALGQSADHVRDFFGALRAELAFYVGCMNLQERLAEKGEPLCLPAPAPAGERRFSARGLYDVCLALTLKQRVIGNDAEADGKDLVIVTGANRGGKSTFLRSVGLAQLMMQSGMFVAAESFRSSLCDGLFTHFKREEDAAMKSGKLDEELGRMSGIVDLMTPDAMILFNESFAATNEREGSEIARQIVSALLERRIRMLFVTHLHEFARGVFATFAERTLFLRADRQADAARTFKLIEGKPLPTSFGEDLYDAIFGPGSAHREAAGTRRTTRAALSTTVAAWPPEMPPEAGAGPTLETRARRSRG